MSINRSNKVQNQQEAFSPTTPSAMYTPSGSFPPADVSATRSGDVVVHGPNPVAPDAGMRNVNAARFGIATDELPATEARAMDLATVVMAAISEGSKGPKVS